MSSKRVLKNTIILYLRMIFQMTVYLYTSRVVVKALGFVDYGIYDVVGSVVISMMFLNNSLLNCTQRFITYTLAIGDNKELSKIFSHSIYIHVAFGVCIVAVGALLGTWYINEVMVLPQDSVDDALFVFYVSLASSFITMISVPYNALIVAHEHMGAFALITIVDVLLKLVAAVSLFLFDNRLRVYALSLLAVAIVVRIIYAIYCNRRYKEVRLVRCFDSGTFKSMLGFLGWNTIGNTAIMCNTQGLNLMLNAVGGPVINAARGLAFQVQSAVVSFINSFQTAINPQITKNYAVGDKPKMNSLILLSSRVSFMLMLFLMVPLLLLTDNLLAFWLGEFPPYTATFVRILLCVSVIESIANPMMMGVSATGNIKRYQLMVGGVMLCTLPVAFVALKVGAAPASVFWALFATTLLAQLIRMWLCRGLFDFSVANFCSQVMLPIVKVAVAGFVPLLLLYPYYEACSGIGAVLVAVVLDIWIAICVFVLGLHKSERDFVLRKIKLK